MNAIQAYALSCIRHQCERGGHPVHPITANSKHELAQAAAYYTLTNRLRAEVDYGLFTTTLRHTLWPYEVEDCQAGGSSVSDRIEDLVTAGQLIVAEIARLWALGHEQLVDVVPVDLHNECNWDAWQGAFLAAGRADGYSEEVLVATNWEAVRRTQFSQGVLALKAYRACFPDPLAESCLTTSNRSIADTIPPSDQLAYAQRCAATWELRTNGSDSTLHCRRCGVYVQAGGTPRCLANADPNSPNHPPERMYYVLNYQHARDGVICFWRPKATGYTSDIKQAGQYPESLIRAELGYYHTGESAVAVACDEIHEHYPTRTIIEVNHDSKMRYLQRVERGVLSDEEK